MVRTEAELDGAVAEAFRHDGEIALEEAVRGREVGCAVLGNGDDLRTGEVDEIEVREGFFDYAEKYTLKNSFIHCPARIPAEQAEAVKEAAKTVYRLLGCRGFARVDMFLTAEGEPVFLECNTIPGMTPHSQYPRMMAAAGLPFPAVVETLIDLALEDRP
jgi:D-alanine---D-serine ligase